MPGNGLRVRISGLYSIQLKRIGKNAREDYIPRMAEIPNQKAAEAILKLNLDSGIQARLRTLADKSNAGTLSEAERVEYQTMVEVIDLLGILHAKARAFLDRQPPSA
jgi:hypothetical protein